MGSKGYKAPAERFLNGTARWISLVVGLAWCRYVTSRTGVLGLGALLVVVIGSGVVAGAAPCPGGQPQVFVVLAVEDRTGDPKWQNQLIALGLRNLVTEELFATGCYIPVETDAEVQGVIDDLVRKSWRGGAADQGKKLAGLQTSVCDTEVRVCVKAFKRSRSRMSFGPFSSGKMTVKVFVELEVRGSDGAVKVVDGVGKGVTRARGALFQIRQDKIYFDESTVGIAAHEAIRAAVRRLLQ